MSWKILKNVSKKDLTINKMVVKKVNQFYGSRVVYIKGGKLWYDSFDILLVKDLYEKQFASEQDKIKSMEMEIVQQRKDKFTRMINSII